MKGYKGFGKGLVCRGKQYEENTVFEESEAIICSKGMHFCENPFDVLGHYELVNEDGSFNEFADVEALAETFTDDNKKYCTTKLKIGAKLSFSGFIKACVDFVIDKTFFELHIPESKGNSNDDSIISSKRYSAQIGSSGYYAQIGSSGNYAKIGSSGNYAKIESTGLDSVICCAGHNSIIKAKKGSWITLSEWTYSETKKDVFLCV